MTTLIRVQTAEPLAGWSVRVQFTNGEVREVDLTPYLGAGPIFAAIRHDPALFRAVVVAGGTLVWPNGADIDPDVLYYGGPPPWVAGLQDQPTARVDDPGAGVASPIRGRAES